MKKPKKKLITLSSVILTVILIFSVLYCAIWAMRLELINKSDSPDSKYTVTAYLDNGGATTPYSVLCTVKNKKIGFQRKIYWEYRCDEAEIEWLDNTTVIINGIELDVKKDNYKHWNG